MYPSVRKKTWTSLVYSSYKPMWKLFQNKKPCGRRKTSAMYNNPQWTGSGKSITKDTSSSTPRLGFSFLVIRYRGAVPREFGQWLRKLVLSRKCGLTRENMVGSYFNPHLQTSSSSVLFFRWWCSIWKPCVWIVSTSVSVKFTCSSCS